MIRYLFVGRSVLFDDPKVNIDSLSKLNLIADRFHAIVLVLKDNRDAEIIYRYGAIGDHVLLTRNSAPLHILEQFFEENNLATKAYHHTLVDRVYCHGSLLHWGTQRELLTVLIRSGNKPENDARLVVDDLTKVSYNLPLVKVYGYPRD